jgi:hypothetical protein
MCGKKTRDVEKGMRKSCEAQIEDITGELEKKWQEENERREKEMQAQHDAALEAHTTKTNNEAEKGIETVKTE